MITLILVNKCIKEIILYGILLLGYDYRKLEFKMNTSDKTTKNDIKIIVLFSLSLLIMIVLTIVDITIFDNQLANEMFTNSISRFIGGVVFVIILF